MRSVRIKVGSFINRMIDKLTGKPEPPYVFKGVKVGDRFKPIDLYMYGLGGVLTVTELTDAGFKYTLEKPYHMFPARYGPSLTHGGEMLINSKEHPKSLWSNSYEKV